MPTTDRLVFTNAAGTVCCDAPADHPERLCDSCHRAFVTARHNAMLAAKRFSDDHPAPAPTFAEMAADLKTKGLR